MATLTAKNRVRLNLVFFGLMFLVMVFWAVNSIVSFNQIDRPYPISAEFPNAFGVLPNSEVTYLGVNYGSVTEVFMWLVPAQQDPRVGT